MAKESSTSVQSKDQSSKIIAKKINFAPTLNSARRNAFIGLQNISQKCNIDTDQLSEDHLANAEILKQLKVVKRPDLQKQITILLDTRRVAFFMEKED